MCSTFAPINSCLSCNHVERDDARQLIDNMIVSLVLLPLGVHNQIFNAHVVSPTPIPHTVHYIALSITELLGQLFNVLKLCCTLCSTILKLTSKASGVSLAQLS